MAETTNLKLFKHDNPSTNDAEFDIDNALNDNWDKIDEIFGNVNDVIVEMQTDVESLKSENDTQNENIEKNTDDISTLKAQKEALEKELERQKEDNRLNSLTEDNEGELIHIDNSTGSRFNSLEIEGNEKQETREGYNLLENHLQNQTINGVDVLINSDKSITLNGTATAFFQLVLLNTDDEPIILKPGNYTMSLKGKIKGINFVGTENEIDTPYLTSTDTNETIEKTYQSETVVTKVLCAISQGTVLNNIKLYPMIYNGIDDKEYEPFGTKPSFDYPSKVECVGDNINLKICNKNLNDNEFEIGTILDDTGHEGTSKNYIRSKNYLRLDSEDYTIFAYKFSGISILNTAIRLYDRNKKYLRNLYIGRIDANTFTFNITEDVYFGRLVCLNNEAVPSDFSVEIQIEKGTTKTDYVEHEEQNHVIPVQQKMFSGDTFKKVNSKWKEMHTWQEVIFNGEENWLMNYGTSLFNLASNNIYNQSSTEHKALCNMAKFENRQAIMADLADKHFAMQSAYNSIFFKDTDFKTAEEFKAKLKELYEAGTPLKVSYKTDTPLILDCTKEQIAVLNKIEQEAHTYLEVTNIYTEDKVGAIIKSNTAVDLKSVINNVVEAQLEQIGG